MTTNQQRWLYGDGVRLSMHLYIVKLGGKLGLGSNPDGVDSVAMSVAYLFTLLLFFVRVVEKMKKERAGLMSRFIHAPKYFLL